MGVTLPLLVASLFALTALAQTDQQFLDAFLLAEQGRTGFPSGVVALRRSVSDAPLTSTAGVGVSPTSLFRIGSITKSFTAVAVLRLVDDALLSLSDSIDQHLPPELRSPSWDARIVVEDLLAHTAGLDDAPAGVLVPDFTLATPLVQHLVRNRPRVTRPPGSVPAYSNYGLGLAGAIVAFKRNLTWGQYLEQQLFPAMGMTNCSFAVPSNIPWTRVAPNTAAFPPRYWFNGEPSGAIVSCGLDMHAYLQFLSNGANPGVAPATGQRILSAASAARMLQSTRWPGVGLGLVTEPFGSEQAAYSHGGDVYGFSSKIHVVPRTGAYYFGSFGADEAPTRADLSCVLGARVSPGVVAPALPVSGVNPNRVFRGGANFLSLNVFSGPLTLSYTLGRVGGGARKAVLSQVPGLYDVVANVLGLPIPFTFQSSDPRWTVYQYAGPRNDSDLAFCRFISSSSLFVVNAAATATDYFTVLQQYGGWLPLPRSGLNPDLVLGVVFAGAAGLFLGCLGLALSLALRRKLFKDDLLISLSSDEGGGRGGKPGQGGGGVLLLWLVLGALLATLAVTIAFFVVYFLTVRSISEAAVATGLSWSFALVAPYVILGLGCVSLVLVVVVLIVRPLEWTLAKERYICAILSVAFVAVLLIGLGNADMLFY